MNSRNNISDKIITHCSGCHELMMDTDDLMIPENGNNYKIICKACHRDGWGISRTRYSKCVLLDNAHCPNCNDFNVIFVGATQRKIKCIYCAHQINIESYVAAALKQK